MVVAALKKKLEPERKTYHATMLVTRAEEWCVEARVLRRRVSFLPPASVTGVILATGCTSRLRASRMSDRPRTRTEQAYRAFKQQVIALAECGEERRKPPDQVEALLREGSMVFAVWRNASELDGLGVLVIKGQPFLRSIIMDNHPLPPNSCVIECQDYAEACALRAS